MSAAIEQTVEVVVATLHRCADGIIEIRMRRGSRVGIPEIEELLQAQLKLARRTGG